MECSGFIPGIGFSGPAPVAGPYGENITFQSTGGRISGRFETALAKEEISGSIDGDRMSLTFEGNQKNRPTWWTISLSGLVTDGKASLEGSMRSINGLTELRKCSLTVRRAIRAPHAGPVTAS
jgi:hypothetical protein